MTEIQEIKNILDEAVSIIGPEREGNLKAPLYEFLRRYGPMPCTDVVIVPEDERLSVILAQRDNKTVAPGAWWMFGGRYGKKMDIETIAAQKTNKEIGLEVDVSMEELIGFGRTYFPPDTKEEKMRDYSIATPNLCFAKRVPITEFVQQKLQPADGNIKWDRFNNLDENWHPYVIGAVASAWDFFYGDDWAKELRLEDKVKKVLNEDRYSFTPYRFKKLKV